MTITQKVTRPRRIAALVATTILGFSTLVGCSSAASSQPDSNAENGLTPLSIIVAPIHFESAYLAERLGFFEKQGLDVEIRPGADAQANFAQALSGDVGIVTTSWTVMVTSNAENVPVSAVASNGYIVEGAVGSGVLVKPDSGIKSIADLSGKTLGVQGVRSGSDLAVLLAAEDEGIDPNSVNQVAIPFPGMQAALESGQVDAIMTVEPFFSQAMKAGVNDLGNMQAKFTPNVPSTVWAATDDWLSKNPETATKFVAAMEEAATYYGDPKNLDEVRTITAEINQTDIAKVSKNPSAIQVEFDKTAVTKNISDLARLGYTTKEVSFSDVVWDKAPLK